MTSAPTKPITTPTPPRPAAPTMPAVEMRRQPRAGLGMMMFAGVLLGVIGFFNLLYGIAAVNRSVVFVTDANYVIWNMRTWGWITLVIGALAMLAAVGVFAGNQLARWFGVFVVAVNALNHMFFMAAYPVWSMVVIAIDIVAIYALCVYGGKETMGT